MIQATDLKNGATFLSNNQPYKVIKYSHVKMGRGGATVRVTSKNLTTGTVEDKTFSSNVKVEEVSTIKRKLQFLYADNMNAVFMDPRTFEQVEIANKVIQDEIHFIKEGEEIVILFWDEKPLSLEIPPKAVFKVKDTPPGVKGNSASNVYKEAQLENGLKVKVPLFIKNGDLVKIDTRTGDYVERAQG